MAPPRCMAPHPFVPAIVCELPAWHQGDHSGSAYWIDPGHEAPAHDDAPTVRLPPIGATVRRRPPPPSVRELKGAELLRALAEELDREGLDQLPDSPDDAGNES